MQDYHEPQPGDLRVWRMCDITDLNGTVMLITDIYEKQDVRWAKVIFNGAMTTFTYQTLLLETRPV